MKKLLIIILIFCCCKFTLVAQQITSNLTLITTDMMSNKQKSSFNWQNISYPRPAARYYFPAIYITQEPDEVGGNNGGSGNCFCPDNKCSGPAYPANDGTLLCTPCNDGSTSCRTITYTPLGPGSSSSGNTNFPPIIIIGAGWGSLLWGNLGNYFTTGFLNPPSYVPSGGGYSSGYIGGGGSAPPPPTGPSYPPPTKPVDDPHGGTNNTKKKDTMQLKIVPCTDSISKILGDSITNLMTKYVDTTAMMKRLRDSCLNNIREEGFTLNMYYDLGTFTTLDSVKTKNYTIATGNQNIPLSFSSSCVLQLHLHTAKNIYGNKIAETPSVGDFKGVLENIVEKNSIGEIYAKHYFGGIVVNAGGNQEQYAIIPKSRQDALAYDSLLGHNLNNMFDTSQNIISYNANTNSYDTTFNRWFANWLGDVKDKKSNRGIYANAISKFKDLGYPSDKLELLAHLVTLFEANIPVKIYIRRNNTFKEIKIEPDTATGFYKGIICN